MSDQELMDLAKRTMGAAADEPVGSIERGIRWAAYDAIVAELQRRMANHVNAELGLGLPEL
jgi:hypothetical protein